MVRMHTITVEFISNFLCVAQVATLLLRPLWSLLGFSASCGLASHSLRTGQTSPQLTGQTVQTPVEQSPEASDCSSFSTMHTETIQYSSERHKSLRLRTKTISMDEEFTSR